MIDRLGPEGVLADEVRLFEGGIHVAPVIVQQGTDVSFHGECITLEAGHLVMHLGGPRLHRVKGADHPGQVLVFHLDQIHGLLGSHLVNRRQGGYGLTYVKYFIPGQYPPVLQGAGAIPDVRRVFRGDHPPDTGHLFGPGCIYSQYASVAPGAFQHLAVEHSWKVDIASVLGPACHLIGGVNPWKAFP